jgi:hypothetical protein
MSFLPAELSAPLLKVVKATSEFGKNTHENVGRLIKEIVGGLVIY